MKTRLADVQLRKPENPYDVSNRRVSIVVKYKDDQEMQATKQHTTVAAR